MNEQNVGTQAATDPRELSLEELGQITGGGPRAAM